MDDDPLRFEDARAFLDTLNPEYVCPYCGFGEATLVATLPGEEGKVPTVPFQSLADGAAAAALQVYFTSCNRCGHVDVFNAALAKRWRRDKEAAPGV